MFVVWLFIAGEDFTGSGTGEARRAEESVDGIIGAECTLAESVEVLGLLQLLVKIYKK